jgi:hypothetical protein
MTYVNWVPYCSMCDEQLQDSHSAIEAHDAECPNKDD